jgi:hypothetical protein
MTKFKFIHIFTRQLSFIYYVLIFIVLQCILVAILSYGEKHVTQNYQSQLRERLENDFRFSRAHYRELSEIIFLLNVNYIVRFATIILSGFIIVCFPYFS